MQVHFGLDQFRAEWERSVVCIGTFDGVHLGHRAVIAAAVEGADAQRIPSILLTFDRHPAAVLRPGACPPAIAGVSTNLREFHRIGVSVCALLPFTIEFSHIPAQAFFDDVLVGALRATEIVVGHDFGFGRGREGTPDWLCERIKTRIVPPFLVDGARVSSSAIRVAVLEGRVEHANRLLGRPFELGGIVVSGDRRGRALGFPTVNLVRSFDQLVPGNGIFACEAETPFGSFRAAASIGTRPTFGGGERTIEAHLIDYPGNSLYGRSLTLRFLRRIRDELKFESPESLIAQMERDVASVRGVE